MNALIESKMAEFRALCERFHVARLELFGSATTEAWDPKTSDFDFLVTFNKPVPPMDIFQQYMGFLMALETLFDRRVDLIEEKAMKNPYMIRSANQYREPIYAATAA